METSEHARGTSDPERSGRNAELAKPIVMLRAMIAKRWERISDLLGDLGIDEKPNLTRKILGAEATSDHIRSEVKRILTHDLPERAKAGELLTLLAETDADATAIEEQRNLLQSENGGIVGSFFQRKKFENYYADKLDFPTRRSLAEEGLLRAADTFDPSMGELSTYAFTWMKSYIRRAAEGSKKHARISLDKEVGGARSGDAATLLALTEDHRAEQPHVIEHRRQLADTLHAVLSEMPVQWRRALELTSGLTEDHRTLKPREAADVMNAEGLRTMKNQVAISPQKVTEWAKQAKRHIAQKMGHLFVEKKEGTRKQALE